MAEIGEKYVEGILKGQGYSMEKIGREDIFAFKNNLGVVVEEKDWKDPVKVLKNKIYQRGINGKWYYKKRSQIVKYGYEIKLRDMENKIYRFIVCVYVFSNLIGRLVQPIYFKNFGTIFCVHRNFFNGWLNSLEKTYLGVPSIDAPNAYNAYMGGK